MNVIFMGTPPFAAKSLEAIVSAGHKVTLVVTQPDKPKGRGKEMAESAVKLYAKDAGLEIFQPERIKAKESVEVLKKYEADIFVVAAFGQILSKEILDMPRFGCINVHASLLPKYRGASPIQWAIINGDKESGVTIMQMNEGLDAGDMIASASTPVLDTDTGESLHDKLAELGAALLKGTLLSIESGQITRTPQPAECESYAPLLTKKMGELDFNKSAKELLRLLRAFTPWPGTYTYINGKVLKVISAAACDDMTEELKDRAGILPGEILCADAKGIKVACGRGSLLFTEVQLEGKKRMSVRDFLLGYKIETGVRLGKEQ